MTYGVPGSSAGRHIVFDAPEASDGTSTVTATAQSSRCLVTITAGSGKGFTGHPLMFQVATASAGCTVTDSTDVPSGNPPPGGGTDGGAGSSSGGSGGSSSGSNPGGGGSSGGDGGTTGGIGGDGGPDGAQPGGASGGCGCGVVGEDTAGGLIVMGLVAWAAARRRLARQYGGERVTASPSRRFR